MNENRIAGIPEAEKHFVPNRGVIQFTALQREALRSLAGAEAELRKLAERIMRRKQAVFAELAKAHELPGDAIVGIDDLERGVGTWTVPQKNQVPEVVDPPTNGTGEAPPA